MKSMTAIIAALLLFFGAIFHLSAVPMLVQEITTIQSAFLKSTFLPIWIMPSQHWITYAVLILILHKNTNKFAKRVLWFIVFSLFFDAAIIFYKLGFFIGNQILLFAAFLTLISTLTPHQFKTYNVEK